MAINTMKDFTIQWVLVGFLITSLLAFAISFTFYNNPLGLSDGSEDVFGDSYSDTSSLLTASNTEANELLNITANTNPEIGDLGSRDSVAVAYKAKGSATGYFDSAKNLMAWVFSGTIGKMLLVVIGTILTLISGFLIAKLIRTGN